MATLKTTVVDAISSLSAAVDPEDLVRKQEMDAAVDGLAPASGVANAISKAHNAVTVPDTNESIHFNLEGQALTGEVVIPDETVEQSADTGLSELFAGPYTTQSTITLAATEVTGVVVKLRLIADHSELATGVADTDYVLNAHLGTILITDDSNLIADGTQEIYVTYDCGEVLNGPALEIVPSGVQVKLGTGHHEAARGDHEHTWNHRPASAGSGSLTLNITVNEIQEINGEVRLKDSTLVADSDGLAVNTGTIATYASVAALGARVTELENATPDSGVPVSVADSLSIDFTRNEDTGEITGDVIVGSGLEIDAEDGVRVDYDVLDTRYPVTTVGSGVPNGVVTGNIGHRFFQTDAQDDAGNNVIKIWEKTENNTDTGWF